MSSIGNILATKSTNNENYMPQSNFAYGNHGGKGVAASATLTRGKTTLAMNEEDDTENSRSLISMDKQATTNGNSRKTLNAVSRAAPMSSVED